MKFLTKQILFLSILLSIGFIKADHKKWHVEDQVKQELDAIFTDPKAQEIIQHELCLKQTIITLLSEARRIGEIVKILPKRASSPSQSQKGFFNSALWRALCHPLKNPLKLLTLRVSHPLKRTLANPYFCCTLLGSSAFIFSNNVILSSYILKLPLGKRLETSKIIKNIIKKLNLQYVDVSEKYYYHVPHTEQTLVIVERISDDLIEERKLRQEEINDIIKVLIILDYLKIPFLDLHKTSNILKTKDKCFLIDTESFWQFGSYYDYLPNTRSFLKHLYGDGNYTLPDTEDVQNVIDQYESAVSSKTSL